MVTEDITKTETTPETKTTEETTTTESVAKNEAKLFSQSELNNHIKNRVSKEAEKFNTASEEWKTKEESYLEQISKFETQLEKLIADKMTDLTPNEKLLLSKLSVLDKLDFLTESKKTENKVAKLPLVPQPSDKKNDKQPEKKYHW